MVFRLSEEAQGFKDTLRRFFENELKGVLERQSSALPADASQKLTSAFAALGLNEIYAANEQALDSLNELVLVAGEIGRALCPQYLLEALVAGPLFLSSFCDQTTIDNLQNTLGTERVQRLQTGKLMVLRTPLFYKDLNTLSIQLQDDTHKLTGTLRLVPHCLELAYILHIEQQFAYLIDVNQLGKIELFTESALDLTQPKVKLILRGAVALKIEVRSSDYYQAISRVLVAAEILGACQKAFEMTTEYVKTRQQFSQPIATFQAVQHALADIYQKIEMLDSLLSFSVWSLRNSPAQSELSSQALLRLALREGVAIVEKTIQLHGGIGFTWEHELHFYLRRVRSLIALAGNQELHDDHFLKVVRQIAVG
jgi:hypothetical protein